MATDIEQPHCHCCNTPQHCHWGPAHHSLHWSAQLSYYPYFPHWIPAFHCNINVTHTQCLNHTHPTLMAIQGTISSILTLYSSRFKTELVPSWTGLCLPSCFQFGIYVMYLSSFINEGVTVLISPQKFKICQRPQNIYCPDPIGLEFRAQRALKF